MNDAKALISGAFADLLAYLTGLSNPIVVGKDYPRKRLLEAFQNWAEDVGFDASEADIHLWREACRHGFFKGSDDGKSC